MFEPTAASYLVSPPFEARSHLIVFLAGIVLALSLPPIDHWFLPVSFADVFRSVPPRYANYRFMGNAIAAGGNVDVLVVGASDAETAFDPKVLQRRAFGPTREADTRSQLRRQLVRRGSLLCTCSGRAFQSQGQGRRRPQFVRWRRLTRMNWQNTGGCIPEPPYRRRCRCESGRRFTPQRCWVRRGDRGPICMEFRI